MPWSSLVLVVGFFPSSKVACVLSHTQDKQGGKSEGSVAPKGELVTQVPHEWAVQPLILTGSKGSGRVRGLGSKEIHLSICFFIPPILSHGDIYPGLWGWLPHCTQVVSKVIGWCHWWSNWLCHLFKRNLHEATTWRSYTVTNVQGKIGQGVFCGCPALSRARSTKKKMNRIQRFLTLMCVFKIPFFTKHHQWIFFSCSPWSSEECRKGSPMKYEDWQNRKEKNWVLSRASEFVSLF